jgi:hypothetical protein
MIGGFDDYYYYPNPRPLLPPREAVSVRRPRRDSYHVTVPRSKRCLLGDGIFPFRIGNIIVLRGMRRL